MKWFKFYGEEYLSDPKMLSLTPCERSCWITLLSYASLDEKGIVKYLTEEKLMIQAGLDYQCEEWEQTQGIFNKLSELKMIKVVKDGIKILHWKKRQDTNLTSYERVKRYRERLRNDNANDNAMITSDKSRVDKIRKEESVSSFKTSKKRKPFYKNDEMRQVKGKWFVLPKDGGEWLEFAGQQKDIEWK
jgi:hypothetical protein